MAFVVRCQRFARAMSGRAAVASLSTDAEASTGGAARAQLFRSPEGANIDLRVKQARKPLDISLQTLKAKLHAEKAAATTPAPEPQQAAAPALQTRLAFIGCGAMGGAILRSVISKGLIPAHNITVMDMSEELLETLGSELGVQTTRCASEAVASSDVVMVCVKPHVIPSVMEGVRGVVDSQLFLSIAAGVTLDTLSATTHGSAARWARVMPNVACLSGAAATTYFPAAACSEDDIYNTEAIFGACGSATRLQSETLLDAATGVAGSGIAYIFMVIEALSDGGVRAGLPRDTATKLAAQTVLGAALMVQGEGKHPGELKDMVCSPGGTTIEAVAALERAGLRSTMIEAVGTACGKARELGAKAKADAAKSA